MKAEILEPRKRTLLEQLQWEADQEMIDDLPQKLELTPGRPTTYDREKFAYLLGQVAEGRLLADVCRDEGMWTYMTVFTWGESSPVIALALARAYESLAANWEVDMVRISDFGGNDTYEGPNGTRVNTDVIQRSKLRIDTREKLLQVVAGNRWRQKYNLMVQDATPGPNSAKKPYHEMTSAELAAEIAGLQSAGPDPEA